MSIVFEARAKARALGVAALFGSAVGVALVGAYAAGGLAGDATTKVRVERLADAAKLGFSEAALEDQASRMDPASLALARRFDPLSDSFTQAEANAFASHLKQGWAQGRLDVSQSDPAVQPMAVLELRGGLGGAFNPAAAPFKVGFNALDSARDMDCLAEAVYYEARGETSAGQQAVAQVVLNRVRHPGFPKSICGVVFQRAAGGPCQFSFACDGSVTRPREAGAWRRAQQVAARALGGFVMPQVGEATHFHAIGVAPGWGPRLLKVAQVGLHVFYRFGGSAGAPGAFTGRAVASPAVIQASADGAAQPTLILASAVTAPAEKLVPGGVGGPEGPAVEPASAPKATKGETTKAEPAKAEAPKPAKPAASSTPS